MDFEHDRAAEAALRRLAGTMFRNTLWSACRQIIRIAIPVSLVVGSALMMKWLVGAAK